MTWKNTGFQQAKAHKKSLVRKDKDLGNVPDRVIGIRYDLHPHTVGRVRNALGIPHFSQEHPRKEELRNSPDLRDMNVVDIAKKYKMGQKLVRTLRHEQGIVVKVNRGYNPKSYKWRKIEEDNQSRRPLLESWTRPKGIDVLLEQINGQ